MISWVHQFTAEKAAGKDAYAVIGHRLNDPVGIFCGTLVYQRILWDTAAALNADECEKQAIAGPNNSSA